MALLAAGQTRDQSFGPEYGRQWTMSCWPGFAPSLAVDWSDALPVRHINCQLFPSPLLSARIPLCGVARHRTNDVCLSARQHAFVYAKFGRCNNSSLCQRSIFGERRSPKGQTQQRDTMAYLPRSTQKASLRCISSTSNVPPAPLPDSEQDRPVLLNLLSPAQHASTPQRSKQHRKPVRRTPRKTSTSILDFMSSPPF
jgi:hypothetical protein